jgi:hypothetical protein
MRQLGSNRPVLIVALIVIVVGAVGCTKSKHSNGAHSNSSSTAAAKNDSTSPQQLADLTITKVYRSGCKADGSSSGFAIRIMVTGHARVPLSGGAYSTADTDPLITADFTPASDAWTGLVTFRPIVNPKATLAAGKVAVSIGFSDTVSKERLNASASSVTVPAASHDVCRT